MVPVSGLSFIVNKVKCQRHQWLTQCETNIQSLAIHYRKFLDPCTGIPDLCLEHKLMVCLANLPVCLLQLLLHGHIRSCSMKCRHNTQLTQTQFYPNRQIYLCVAGRRHTWSESLARWKLIELIFHSVCNYKQYLKLFEMKCDILRNHLWGPTLVLLYCSHTMHVDMFLGIRFVCIIYSLHAFSSIFSFFN